MRKQTLPAVLLFLFFALFWLTALLGWVVPAMWLEGR